MNSSQKSTFEEIKTELEKEIREIDHKIVNIGRLKLYPKKDGTEKANLPLNFGTVECEYFTIKRCNRDEKIRCVKVELNNYNIHLDFSPVWDNEDPNRYVPLYPSTEHYLNYPEGKNASNITAKEIFEMATGPHLDSLKAEKKKYEDTLANLSSYFDALCKMATDLDKYIKSTYNIPIIHRYAYELQGRGNWKLTD